MCKVTHTFKQEPFWESSGKTKTMKCWCFSLPYRKHTAMYIYMKHKQQSSSSKSGLRKLSECVTLALTVGIAIFGSVSFFETTMPLTSERGGRNLISLTSEVEKKLSLHLPQNTKRSRTPLSVLRRIQRRLGTGFHCLVSTPG